MEVILAMPRGFRMEWQSAYSDWFSHVSVPIPFLQVWESLKGQCIHDQAFAESGPCGGAAYWQQWKLRHCSLWRFASQQHSLLSLSFASIDLLLFLFFSLWLVSKFCAKTGSIPLCPFMANLLRLLSTVNFYTKFFWREARKRTSTTFYAPSPPDDSICKTQDKILVGMIQNSQFCKIRIAGRSAKISNCCTYCTSLLWKVCTVFSHSLFGHTCLKKSILFGFPAVKPRSLLYKERLCLCPFMCKAFALACILLTKGKWNNISAKFNLTQITPDHLLVFESASRNLD